MAGGLFQDDFGGDQSEFFTKTEDIPDFSIWRFNLQTKTWTGEPFSNGSNGRLLERTYAGAGMGVPALNLSFYQGGLYDNRTSPRNANLSGDHPQDGMLIFNHKGNTIRNRSLADSIGAKDQYWGTLRHFPLGKLGFLLSLQAEELNLTGSLANRLDYGPSVSWSTVHLYDIKNDKWYEQYTSAYHGQHPTPRTRFCSVVAKSPSSESYELWIYGGQIGTGANATGVDDIWVLSLPGFRWFKVLDPYTENRRRSATCHGIGRHLFVIGGNNPRQEDIVESADCDSGLVKIYDMNSQAWTDKFDVSGGAYKPSKEITDWYKEYGMKPLDGYDSPEVRALLETHHPREWVPAVVGAVASVFAAAALGLAVYLLIWRRRAPVVKVTPEPQPADSDLGGVAPDPMRLVPTGTTNAELEDSDQIGHLETPREAVTGIGNEVE
ncbi:MAG: hypothetical protein M1839_004581 [Geoglossum umbratile]|nr:MAG: hypothetical protein M1839_004581 [Geoglossum umbratile]